MHKDVGVVDARKVGHTRRLLLGGVESERVGVDEAAGDRGPGLPRHHEAEVAGLAHGEAVVVVERELDHGDGVLTVETGVVEPILAGDVAVALHEPEEGLHGVVQVELEAVRSGDAETTLEVHRELLLHLRDQVFVRHLGEATALVSVQEHVIHVEEGVQIVGAQGREATAAGLGLERDGEASAVVVDVGTGARHEQVLHAAQVELNAHLVILEGNQGQGETGVAVEPKLQGRVVAAGQLGVLDELGARETLSNHLLEAAGRVGRQLLPDLEELTELLVDALSTDEDLHALDDGVADGVGPVHPGVAVAILVGVDDGGQVKHKVDLLGQITRTLDDGVELLAERRITLEGDLDRLLGKVGVTAIHGLEERDLRVGRDVKVLGPDGHQRHESSTSHFSKIGTENFFSTHGPRFFLRPPPLGPSPCGADE